MNIRIKTNEYFSINLSTGMDLWPIKPNRIFEPSSGGIGIRLNIARTIFTSTTVPASGITESEIAGTAMAILTNMLINIAMAMFVRIPADATQIEPTRLSSGRKFSGL